MEVVEWGVGIVWFGDCGVGFGWGEGGVERCDHSCCAFGEWALILKGRFRDAFVLIRQVTWSVRVCLVLGSGVPFVIWDYRAVWGGCVVYAKSLDEPIPPSGSSASMVVDCGKSRCLCGSGHPREMVPSAALTSVCNDDGRGRVGAFPLGKSSSTDSLNLLPSKDCMQHRAILSTGEGPKDA